MEAALLKFAVIAATGAAVIKFLLYEWAAVTEAWRRAKKGH